MAPHGVTLAASFDTAYIRHDTSTGTSGFTLEMLAGLAANAYSQGADKIYYYNYNTVLDFDGPVKDEDKMTITRDGTLQGYGCADGNVGTWVTWNTLGSYEKVLGMNRRCIPTFNDTRAPWQSNYKGQIFPTRFNTDTNYTFRIPVGDVLEGSTLTLYIAGSSDAYLNPPTVYVNSEPCKFVGVGSCLPTKRGTFTEEQCMLYEIPAKVHHETYMVVELNAPVGFWCPHAEIHVEAPIQ